MTDTEPMRVRTPPPGLDKDGRRDWQEQEAQRIADLQDRARTAGFRAVRAAAPPKGLGRAGRKAWREADRENRSRRMEAEAAGTESDRYVGALVLMAVIGVVIALRVLFSGGGDGSDEPAPQPAPAAVVTSTSTSPSVPLPVRGE